MSGGDWAEVALAILAAVAGVTTLVSWFYRRGGAEVRLTDAVKANTQATDKLTQHMEKVGETLNDHSVKLADHDARLRSGGL